MQLYAKLNSFTSQYPVKSFVLKKKKTHLMFCLKIYSFYFTMTVCLHVCHVRAWCPERSEEGSGSLEQGL